MRQSGLAGEWARLSTSNAASASLGLARYRSPYTSTARCGSSGTACAFDDDEVGDDEASDPVMSDMVWQPPRPAARIAVTAAEERNRARDPARDREWLDCRRMGTSTHGNG